MRLLDFGIAKLLDEGTARQTALTELARPSAHARVRLARAGRGRAAQHRVRCVFARRRAVRAADRHAALQAPARFTRGAGRRHPSDRRRTLRAPSATDASLRRALRGDLDTIVLKALKKKPDERYSTVNAFADDLQRYLDGRPVLARPDSASYRLSKFVRRNKIAVGAAAVARREPRRVRRASPRGRRACWPSSVAWRRSSVTRPSKWFACSSICSRPPTRRCGPTATACRSESSSRARRHGRSSVCARHPPYERSCSRSSASSTRRAASTPRRVRRSRRRSPSSAGWRVRISRRRSNRSRRSARWRTPGDDERARALLEESLERHRRVYGDEHERTARVLYALAPVVATRDLDEAGKLLMRSLDIRRAALGRIIRMSARAWRRSVSTTTARRNTIARETLSIRRSRCSRRPRIGGTQSRSRSSTTLRSLHGTECARRGRGAAARSHRSRPAGAGPETMTVANLINSLGTTQAFMGRHADAERSFQAAFETHRSLLGDDPLAHANVARNVGRALALQQRYADALPWMDRGARKACGRRWVARAGWWGIRAQRAQVLFRLGRRERSAGGGDGCRRVAGAAAANDSGVAALHSPACCSGECWNEMGRPHEAERALTAVERPRRLGARASPACRGVVRAGPRSCCSREAAPRTGNDWNSACRFTAPGVWPSAKSWVPRTTSRCPSAFSRSQGTSLPRSRCPPYRPSRLAIEPGRPDDTDLDPLRRRREPLQIDVAAGSRQPRDGAQRRVTGRLGVKDGGPGIDLDFRPAALLRELRARRLLLGDAVHPAAAPVDVLRVHLHDLAPGKQLFQDVAPAWLSLLLSRESARASRTLGREPDRWWARS